jgi:hypothetical protein
LQSGTPGCERRWAVKEYMSCSWAAAAVSLLLFVAVEAPSAQTQAEAAPPPQLPVSLSRIREALKKPEGKLAAPQRQADFKVEIAEEQRFQDLVDLLDFSAIPVLPAVRFGGSQTQPLINVSLTGIGQSVVRGVAKARRERAERLAQEEVQRALNQFCATHECLAR